MQLFSRMFSMVVSSTSQDERTPSQGLQASICLLHHYYYKKNSLAMKECASSYKLLAQVRRPHVRAAVAAGRAGCESAAARLCGAALGSNGTLLNHTYMTRQTLFCFNCKKKCL